MSNINKATQSARDLKMIAGIQKHLGNVVSLVIAGQSYTPSQCVDALKARVDADDAATAAKSTYLNLVQVFRAKEAQTKLFVAALRVAIYIMFSSQVDTLADFGILPHKTRKAPAPVQKVAAVKKAEATRAARHTMGKKQKAKITGVVPATVASASAPANAAPQPTESPSPAPPKATSGA